MVYIYQGTYIQVSEIASLNRMRIYLEECKEHKNVRNATVESTESDLVNSIEKA